MSSYEELRKEFERKVKKLQEQCNHEKLSNWIPYQSASGHYTGREVKSCKRCNLIVNERTKCSLCKSYVEKKDWIKGDGDKVSFGTYFCSEACLIEYIKLPLPEGVKSKD